MEAPLSTAPDNVVVLPIRARRTASVQAPVRSAHGPGLAEVLGGLSLALDLSEGQPAGHALRCTWIAQRLGRALGLTLGQLRELYYTTLLKDLGGSANAGRIHQLFRTDDLGFKRDVRIASSSLFGQLRFVLAHAGTHDSLGGRVRVALNAMQNGNEIARELSSLRASRGAQLARHLGLSDTVAEGIAGLDEAWDGSGQPEGMSEDEIPLFSRLARLAQGVDVFHTRSGARATREQVARRRERQLDPALCDAFAILSRDEEFWVALAADDLDRRVIDSEPAPPPLPLEEEALDNVAVAFGLAVDAKSPFTAGHSTRVAAVSDRICAVLGLEDDQRRWLRRGALLHDLGMLGVSNTLRDKPGSLTCSERSLMQGHAGTTGHLLARIGTFGTLARVAAAHHEKLDGTGYPRGLDARHLRQETRIITTADIFDALTCERAHRPAFPIERALAVMRDEVGSSIDGDCFAALEQVVG